MTRQIYIQSKSSYCMVFVPWKFYAFIPLCNCAICYYLSHIVTSLEVWLTNQLSRAVCHAFWIPSHPTLSCTNVSILAVWAQMSPVTEVPIKVWSQMTRSLWPSSPALFNHCLNQSVMPHCSLLLAIPLVLLEIMDVQSSYVAASLMV